MSNLENRRRRSIRLKDYDYSAAGAYFVTVCTYQRECFLGEVMDERFQPSEYGAIVQNMWDGLPEHYSMIELDAFVVMPNHIHGIILLDGTVGAGLKPAPTPAKPVALSEIVRGFKTFSARHINEQRNTPGNPVWQRNYYEHIIRSEVSLDKVRQYILTNPARWAMDKENPSEWSS